MADARTEENQLVAKITEIGGDEHTSSAVVPAVLAADGSTGQTTTNITSDKGVVLKDVTGSVNISISHYDTKPSTTEDIILKAVSQLKKEYSEMAASLMIPWLQSEPFDMEECISKTETIVSYTDASGSNIKSQFNPEKLDHIFDRMKGLKPARIFLQDEEGFLYSMLLLQLCKSWAYGQGPAIIFDLVIFLDARELETKTIDNVIIQKCHTDGVDDDSLLKIVKDNKRVLLIFNNLPTELQWGRKTELIQVLNGNHYEDATVLVSYQFFPESEISEYWNRSECTIYSAKGCCTKFVQLYRCHLIPKTDYQRQFINDRIPTLWRYFSPHLHKPMVVLFKTHVYVGGEYISSEINADMSIFAMLLKHHFGYEDPQLHVWHKYRIPTPEVDLLSRIGEYFLTVAVSKDFLFTREGIEAHFPDEAASILKLGFIEVTMPVSGHMPGKKLQLVCRKLLEFLVSYHLWVVYKTEPTDAFLQKLDLANAFQPLDRCSSEFMCRRLADVIKSDVKDAYITTSRRRPQYTTLVFILERAYEELETKLM